MGEAIRIPGRFPSAQDLAGKVVLVTGAGRGLGLVIAHGLAAAGAEIVAASRTLQQVEAVAAQLRSAGHRALAVACDVTDAESVERAVARAVEECGRIDVLINNAGISPVLRSAERMSLADWRAILDTNLTGAFICSQAVAPLMIERKRGKVISTASTLGQVGFPGLAAYCASKGGLIQLTRVLALDWAAHNIQVNCVAPGFFQSPLAEGLMRSPSLSQRILGYTPISRWGRGEDLVGAYVFLASDASDWVTGQVIAVDGGYTAA